MMQRLLVRLVPGCFTSVVMLAIMWLTLAPEPLGHQDAGTWPEGTDKVVHAVMFGLLTLAIYFDSELLCQRRYERTRRLPRKAGLPQLLLMAVAATLVGGLIELLQGWMGMGRGCDILDFAADGVGALAVALVLAFRR